MATGIHKLTGTPAIEAGLKRASLAVAMANESSAGSLELFTSPATCGSPVSLTNTHANGSGGSDADDSGNRSRMNSSTASWLIMTGGVIELGAGAPLINRDTAMTSLILDNSPTRGAGTRNVGGVSEGSVSAELMQAVSNKTSMRTSLFTSAENFRSDVTRRQASAI